MIPLSLNVLIGEDNQHTASQYNRIIGRYGHKVTITKDGDECLRKYQEELRKSEFASMDKNPFDVVVLDQSMPKKTGAEVAEKILAIKPTQRIVFASASALTGENNSNDLKLRIEFLQKPFSLTKFINRVLRK